MSDEQKPGGRNVGLSAGLGDLRSQMIAQLALGLTRKKNYVIRTAVSAALHRDDWTVEELMGRCAIKILPNRNEVFCLDGVDLVEFSPAVSELTDASILTAHQSYRLVSPNA